MNDINLIIYVWAITATTAAAWYMRQASKFQHRYESTGDLLCDLALGDAKVIQEGDGRYTIENNKSRLSFRRVRHEMS